MLSINWVIAHWRRALPRSLLDNVPLAGLLQRLVRTERLRRMIEEGHLHALAITASSYGSGQHVTFYDARGDIVPWTRKQRIAVREPIGIPHLLGSSAIPFVFPAVSFELQRPAEWFGDGSMRQSAPISPAVHLGAERILVIGAGRMHEPPGRHAVSPGYPSLAQIAGHAMSSTLGSTEARAAPDSGIDVLIIIENANANGYAVQYPRCVEPARSQAAPCASATLAAAGCRASFEGLVHVRTTGPRHRDQIDGCPVRVASRSSQPTDERRMFIAYLTLTAGRPI